MKKDIGTELMKLSREIYNIIPQWSIAIKSLIRTQENLQQSLRLIEYSNIEFNLAIERSIAPIAKQFAVFQRQINLFTVEISRAFKQLPQRIKDSLRILAKNGWYIDLDFQPIDLFNFATLFESGKSSDANNLLCDYFDSRLVEIEEELYKQFPVRANLLYNAFKAHRLGKYALSIPVFLAQADGICQEKTGILLYSRKNGVPKLASNPVICGNLSFLDFFLSPLIEPMPISASRKERINMNKVLNRHAVLHGESTDYDTHLNSCQAISLLVYVSWILRNDWKLVD